MADRMEGRADPVRVADLVRLAEAASDFTRSDRQAPAAELLDRADEVIASVEWLLDADGAAALRLCAALPLFWQDAGRVAEGRRLTEQAIMAADGPPTAALAGALVAAAELAFRQSDQDAAAAFATRAIETGTTVGDVRSAGLGHVNLARVAFRDGNAAEIDRCSRAALAAGGADLVVRRGALHMLAWAAHTAGDIALARARFEDSLALRAELGDRFGVAVESSNLADLAIEAGTIEEGARRLAEALEVARELGSQYLLVNLLPSIAMAALARGDADRAARLLGATDTLSAASGLTPDPGAVGNAIGQARAALGAAFDRVHREGAALASAAAVELALRTARSVSGGTD